MRGPGGADADLRNGFVEVFGGAGAFGRDAHHSFGAASALRRGIAHPCFEQAFRFQPFNGGVECPNGASAPGPLLDLQADGSAVGVFIERGGNGENDVFEFSKHNHYIVSLIGRTCQSSSIDALPDCLVLDVALPGLNGLDLQTRVAVEHPGMPIIFITGHGDIPMTVQAMKAGAVEFLTKPFKGDVLLQSVRNALERSKARLGREEEIQTLKARYSDLTSRERDVMALVVGGLLNKQVGGRLGISEVTVKKHRGNAMQKMKAESLAELVKMAARLRLRPTPTDSVLLAK